MKAHIAAMIGLTTAWACGTAPMDVSDVDTSTASAVEDGSGPFDVDGDGELSRAEQRMQQRYTHQQMGECRAALYEQLDENGDNEIDEAEQTRAREQLQQWMNGECPFDGECECEQDREQLQQRTQTREQARLHSGEGCEDCEPAHQRDRDRIQDQSGECAEPPCGDGDMTQEHAGECAEPPCGDGDMTQEQSGECDEPPCGDQTCDEPPCGECQADAEA